MPARTDIGIAFCLAALGCLEPTVLGSVDASPGLTVPLTVLAVAPVAWRRVAPGPAAAATLAVLAALEFAADEPASGMAVFLAMLLGVGSLMARADLAEAVAWGVATLALLSLAVAADLGADSGDFAYAWTMWLIAAGVGRALRTRQLRADASAQRAAEAEREGREAVEAERARLARELHDVVAHGLSVIHVQSRVAAQLLERDPNGARRALAAVEDVAHDALGDMRRMLELLRIEGERALEPQRGVDDIPALLERTREAGLPLEFDVDGAPVSLPPGLDLAVYRFVQEGLTNVLKHAGHVPTRVRLVFRPEAVAVEIVNEQSGATAAAAEGSGGHGLLGMRERAAVFDGDFEAGPRPHGGFAVLARLPLRIG
ncbi:MAG: histidine kinase [Actinomycetota bacterium]|nr:histidine kinase [Actinomycetota bacterium]